MWRRRLHVVLAYQAPVLFAVGVALLAPLAMAAWDAHGLPPAKEAAGFLGPSAAALLIGAAIRIGRPSPASLPQHEALLVTTAAWLTASIVGAIPFLVVVGMPFEDALFESVAGFTTVGASLIRGADTLPRSILLWRALMQWLGGLGILVVILLVGQSQGSQALSLLNAEGVKVSSGRLSLNFRRATLKFAQIYLALTAAQITLLLLLGLSWFDSVTQSMATASTGGFSPHDQGIAYYRLHPVHYPNYVVIELVFMLFMIAGAINYYVLYRLVRQRQMAALWDGFEMRLFWLVLAVAAGVVAITTFASTTTESPDWLMRSVFQVVALVSTTGFEIAPLDAFPRLAQEIFLLLMLIGGTAGSTAGGYKLVRAGMVIKVLGYEVRRLRLPPHAISQPTLDGRPIGDNAFRQAVFILLLWLGYIVLGGLVISSLAPDLDIADAYSTVTSAIGGYGPSLAPATSVAAMPPLAKGVLMVGMLAGRLEILPLLVFLNPAAWRK